MEHMKEWHGILGEEGKGGMMDLAEDGRTRAV